MPNELTLSQLTPEQLVARNLPVFDFSDPDKITFTEKELVNADFSKLTLERVCFSDVKLTNCNFEKAQINDCFFRKAIIEGTGGKDKIASFLRAKIKNTKFTGATINVCDFRYAEVTDCSMYNATFKHTDLHRTAFKGITVFQEASFELCSLNYVAFENFCITKNNLKESQKKSVLVQEDYKEFEKFLDLMPVRKGGLPNHFAEAERIYRQFSTMWENKGNNRDGNWAYMQAKEMECQQLLDEVKLKKSIMKGKCKLKDICTKVNNSEECKKCHEINICKNWLKAIKILFIGKVLGYGVKMRNVLLAFAFVTAIFTPLYCNMVKDSGNLFIKIIKILLTSVGFTIGIGERSALGDGLFYYLSMLQSGIGIFLLGVFGFMVANKIRKS